MKFGKAKDLANQILAMVAEHGDDLEIAFYADEETINTSNDSVVGAIKVDGVENTSPPRLDLAFKDQG